MTTRRRALSEPTADVLESPALGVLLALEADGFAVAAVGDRVRVKPISRLTSERRAEIEQYRHDLLLLLRVCDEGVQVRRLAYVEQLAKPGESRVTCLACATPAVTSCRIRGMVAAGVVRWGRVSRAMPRFL
jgi:hypothetical protein